MCMQTLSSMFWPFGSVERCGVAERARADQIEQAGVRVRGVDIGTVADAGCRVLGEPGIDCFLLFDPPSVWWTPMLAFRSWRGVSDECSTPELSGFFQARGR